MSLRKAFMPPAASIFAQCSGFSRIARNSSFSSGGVGGRPRGFFDGSMDRLYVLPKVVDKPQLMFYINAIKSRNGAERMNTNSMSAQHTPGPWIVGVSADHTPMVLAGNSAVAHVYMQRFSVGRGPKEEETQANACLITAGPEMLDFLKLLESSAFYIPANSSLRAQLRALIAKATGSDS